VLGHLDFQNQQPAIVFRFIGKKGYPLLGVTVSNAGLLSHPSAASCKISPWQSETPEWH
jgi:hypothetical protein